MLVSGINAFSFDIPIKSSQSTTSLVTQVPYSLYPQAPLYTCTLKGCVKNSGTSLNKNYEPLSVNEYPLSLLGSSSSSSGLSSSSSLFGSSSSSSLFGSSSSSSLFGSSSSKTNYKTYPTSSFGIGPSYADTNNIWSPLNYASTTRWKFTVPSSGSSGSSTSMSVPNPFAGSNVPQNGVFWNPSKGL